jgi:hypothetical protein
VAVIMKFSGAKSRSGAMLTVPLKNVHTI